MSSSSPRASRRPLLMWKLPSRSGSLISPFQPTVVRGFSKYTRMTISSAPSSRSRCSRSRPAYSSAAAVIVDRARTDDDRETVVACRAGCGAAARRAASTVADAGSLQGYSLDELFGRAQLADVADAQVVGTNVHS